MRCLLCDGIIATSGSKYEEHLRDWHNVTLQRMLQQLIWMSPYNKDISENPDMQVRIEEQAVEEQLEVQEEVGKQSQEKSGEKLIEEYRSSSSYSPSIKFNPQCVVQTVGVGK